MTHKPASGFGGWQMPPKLLSFERYGGRRALVHLLWENFRLGVGIGGRYRAIDWRRVDRLVFVCKGNICRSPFAEAMVRGWGLNACSAGLDASAGVRADQRAIGCAASSGVDLTSHLAQPLSQLQLQPTDLLVAFEPKHAQELLSRSNEGAYQVTLLGCWCETRRWAYLHDPYGLSPIYFDACFDRIARGLAGLRSHWAGR